jgi:iodotyrosine deiodinase
MHQGHLPFKQTNQAVTDQELIERTKWHYATMNARRSIRDISDKPIPYEVIENLVLTASTAPSGAHKQPWTFCVVQNPELKQKIREAAEKEEYENYHGRMTNEWLKDLAIFGTDWHKEFITKAPYLIVVFKKSYDLFADGSITKNYYVNESVGIACGFLLQAIHQAGLVSLTHTPSPMNFLAEILNRPKNEKAFLLIPVGYAAENATVPDIERKPLSEVLVKY